VNPKIQLTLDAAVLSKMGERGQIRGGIIDGPLAMDNAVSLDAAETKGLTSLVAGPADILVVPNLEVGNILAKDLTYASARRKYPSAAPCSAHLSTQRLANRDEETVDSRGFVHQRQASTLGRLGMLNPRRCSNRDLASDLDH
jgi:hypothetical protein